MSIVITLDDPPKPMWTVSRKSAAKDLPAVSCVYFVYRGGGIVYVGKSRFLPGRIGGHHVAEDGDGLSWIVLPQSEITHVEASYIGALKPPMNDGGCAKKSTARRVMAPPPVIKFMPRCVRVNGVKSWMAVDSNGIRHHPPYLLREDAVARCAELSELVKNQPTKPLLPHIPQGGKRGGLKIREARTGSGMRFCVDGLRNFTGKRGRRFFKTFAEAEKWCRDFADSYQARGDIAA